MLRKITKRCFSIVLCLISLFLIGCAGKNEDKVVALSVCEEFYSQEIFVDDIVKLEDFYIVVTFSSGESKNVLLSDTNLTGLDTSTAGTHNVIIEYLGKKANIEYIVKSPTIVNATYKADTLNLFIKETPDFSKVNVTLLYSNGDEKIVPLSSAELGEIDYTLSGETKYLTADFSGVVLNIPYTARYREINTMGQYSLENQPQFFSGANWVEFVDNIINFYNNTDQSKSLINSFTIYNLEYNRFYINYLNGGDMVKVVLYLANNKIYCELYQETESNLI